MNEFRKKAQKAPPLDTGTYTLSLSHTHKHTHTHTHHTHHTHTHTNTTPHTQRQQHTHTQSDAQQTQSRSLFAPEGQSPCTRTSYTTSVNSSLSDKHHIKIQSDINSHNLWHICLLSPSKKKQKKKQPCPL